MIERMPVFGICGYSGSGKTTLIEELLGRLHERQLTTAVIKHDVHGLSIDCEGKDSDRFFKAGADVVMRSTDETFLRFHRAADVPLQDVLHRICPFYDVMLVEGHKATPLPYKIWVLSDDEDVPPPEAGDVGLILPRGPGRLDAAWAFIEPRLLQMAQETPLRAGILMGGEASRMGEPKHLLSASGVSWLERTVSVVRPLVDELVLLGAGEVPASLSALLRLPDVPGRRGPLAGMLSAMRWSPFGSWLFLACDLPMLSREAVEWLLATRAPGVWATVPRLDKSGRVEPLLAHYDFRAAPLIEFLGRPRDLAEHEKVITPQVPHDLAPAWRNVNTPEELAALS